MATKKISICLQAGHQNIQKNCAADMRGGTGASGEITWTPMIRGKVASLLLAHGFEVHQVDANVNCTGPNGPFNLTLAIHYQSNTGTSGFGVYVPDKTADAVNPTSIKLANAIRKIYAARTKLADYSDPAVKGPGPTWSNPNTRFYYLWKYQKGPLALIECGEGAVGAPNHGLLYGHPDIIASAIAEGICSAFGVKWVASAPAPKPVVPPTPVPTPTPVTKPPVTVPPPDPAAPQPEPILNPPAHDHPEPLPQLPSLADKLATYFQRFIAQIRAWF